MHQCWCHTLLAHVSKGTGNLLRMWKAPYCLWKAVDAHVNHPRRNGWQFSPTVVVTCWKLDSLLAVVVKAGSILRREGLLQPVPIDSCLSDVIVLRSWQVREAGAEVGSYVARRTHGGAHSFDSRDATVSSATAYFD